MKLVSEKAKPFVELVFGSIQSKLYWINRLSKAFGGGKHWGFKQMHVILKMGLPNIVFDFDRSDADMLDRMLEVYGDHQVVKDIFHLHRKINSELSDGLFDDPLETDMTVTLHRIQ